MARNRTGYIQIDLADYIDDIDDDTIADEFVRRKLDLKTSDVPNISDELRDAYEELLRNRPAEARAILERLLRPKWKSPEQCETAYKAHTS